MFVHLVIYGFFVCWQIYVFRQCCALLVLLRPESKSIFSVRSGDGRFAGPANSPGMTDLE
jgi:hypothetical protein